MSKMTNALLVGLLFVSFSFLGYKTIGTTESEAYETREEPQTMFERHAGVLSRHSEAILNVDIKNHPVLGNNMLQATLRAEQKLTRERTRQHILKDTYRIMDHAFMNGAETVQLVWKVQTMNAYDILDDVTVMVVSVSAEDAKNTDWSSMTEEELKEISGHFREEPVLSGE